MVDIVIEKTKWGHYIVTLTYSEVRVRIDPVYEEQLLELSNTIINNVEP